MRYFIFNNNYSNKVKLENIKTAIITIIKS